jgi:hypothetical protein
MREQSLERFLEDQAEDRRRDRRDGEENRKPPPVAARDELGGDAP